MFWHALVVLVVNMLVQYVTIINLYIYKEILFRLPVLWA
jgi:hypothetical protein